MNEVEILIIGGGPAGLGAAVRLVGSHREWVLLEADPGFGGLSSSFIDDQGFTWDLGGHVLFSHYDSFDRYMDESLGGDGWFEHERESWVWMRQRFVPYPLQNNLYRLPPADRWQCVQGLMALARTPATPANFAEWVDQTFGEGLAHVFLRPYNWKVWAWPLAQMDWRWVGERVSVVSLEQVLRGICLEQDDVVWGPNRKFRFPRHGGTGTIWEALGRRLPAGHVRMNSPVVTVDPARHTVQTRDGTLWRYRNLISTMPLDRLLAACVVPACALPDLPYSSTHVLGVGIAGQPPEALRTKCWMYFPEANSPYYRVTVFSNYSRFNVPRPGETWSLMAEVSCSRHKPVDAAKVAETVTAALRTDGLLPAGAEVVSQAHRFIPHSYPTPFLGRDARVQPLLDGLERDDIYSRGRFGAWKYEVGNMDHCFAQGYECAGRLIHGLGPETEPTLREPGLINARRNP